MWEAGLHGGITMSWGDVDFVPNWGAGIHIRRAIDYVFSLRAEGLYAVLKNEDNDDGTTETTFMSGSLEVLFTLNNLIWNANKNRKANLFLIGGGGINRFKLDVKNAIDPIALQPLDYKWQSNGNLGVGAALRISERLNLGIESKAMMVFGKRDDLVDGVERQDNDIISYTSVRLNFNLGNAEKRAEPLYWVNPMDVIMKDITELKERPAFDLTDTDGDGVIDLMDQDNTTPAGAIVDTRGIPLDSDGDGIPNHEDDEPYIALGKTTSGSDDNSRPTKGEVKDLIKDELGNYFPSGSKSGDGSKPGAGNRPGGNTYGGGGLANWFLPIIHFDIDSYKVRYADYGNLANVAKVLKGNPDLQVVVTGFTDKTASNTYNLDLSFKRASAAIEHLVKVHGIARSRLILNYNGEDEPLVPSAGSNLMNRRVEFKVATDEIDMEKPVPVSGKNGKKRGY